MISGEQESGVNIALGAAQDAVGIAPTHNLLTDEVYNDASALVEKMKSGEIVVPKNADELETYIASL